MSRKIKKQSRTTLKRKLNADTRSDIVKRCLEMLNCVKLYHWATYSYSQHIATDDLYSDLNKHVDEFVEIMLGKTKQRIKQIQLNNSYDVGSKAKFMSYVKDFKEYLIDMRHVLSPVTDTNLMNIRDEILGTLDKLCYLFELR